MKKAGNILVSNLIKPAILIIGFFIHLNTSYAQNYNFSHFGIEDGLIQSQVTNFYEDGSHRLWISTLGGACRFDGKEYYNVTREKGLVNNFVYCVHADRTGKIWFGTLEGLCYVQRGKFYYFKNPLNNQRPFVSSMAEDGRGVIWCTIHNHLFQITGNQMQLVKASGDINELVTCVAADNSGKLFVSVYQKGIYAAQANGWRAIIPFNAMVKTIVIQKIIFDQRNAGILYFLTRAAVYRSDGNSLQVYEKEKLAEIPTPFLSIENDENNNLWIGTKNGVFELVDRQLIHFTAENGFSDFPVFDIYKDRANNLWLGTEGDGFYKYEGDNYRTYSHTTQNKKMEVVVGIGEDKKHDIIVGTDNNGLLKYQNNQLTPFWSATNNFARTILSLYTDSSQDIWVGTDFGGIWKFDGNRFQLIKGTERQAINAIGVDGGTVWFGTPTGCYYINGGVVAKLKAFNSFVSSLLVVGRDSVVIGTQHGAFLLINKEIVPGFRLTELSSSSVFCILRNKNDLLFGTDDKGLFIFNNKTHQIKNYDTRDGLKSSCIYSMVADKKGVVWVGTGLGVDRMLDGPNLDYKVLPNIYSKNEVAETNQNSAYCVGNNVFFGSTKGLTVYNANIKPLPSKPPFIVINDVNVLTQEGKKVDRNDHLPDKARVYKHDENHLVISFLGVDLKNPDGVLYQYKLLGPDLQFCSPVKNHIVDYPALPPGKYVFEVKAINAGGVSSNGVATYAFEISQAYYQTTIFRLAIFLLLIASIFMVQTSFRRSADRRKASMELMKQEEKIKLREQTAQDFHDDLGNKLTRITILSDILHAKFGKDKTELGSIVDQIKRNAEALFHGTKEILWALDPKSDNLYEILHHIKYFAHELFLDTSIKFKMKELNTDLKEFKLPMEYSRNISLIFKELLNNILKHADAKNATLNLHFTSVNEFNLQLSDDGKGFNELTIKRGHGLKNITARAKRINGQFLITSKEGEGTSFVLKLKLRQ